MLTHSLAVWSHLCLWLHSGYCIVQYECVSIINILQGQLLTLSAVSEILTEAPYNWSTTAAGLVFLAALVGSIVGWATGILADRVVLLLARRNGGVKEPEMRLWTLPICFVYAAVGYFLYGWGAQTGASWVTIAIGIGCMIAHQVSACSIATAYAMDSFPGVSDAADCR